MSIRPHRFALTICVLLATFASCSVPPEPTVPDLRRSKALEAFADYGLVYMFPGLVGPEWELGPAYRGLRDAGLVREFRFFQWDTPGLEVLDHLTEYEHNRQKAAQVAEEICAYHAEHPRNPIDLVGYSAGGALALWVAEALPEHVLLRQVVLAQPGVSPTYDLTTALRRIDGQLVVLYCPTDLLLAGAFTSLFGTLDRRYTVAAGQSGFDLDVAVSDPALRSKVVQEGYSDTWAEVGHPGNHMAILQYRWNRYIVAPYLLDEPAEDSLSALDWLARQLLDVLRRQPIQEE